jgi:hypothetical protein
METHKAQHETFLILVLKKQREESTLLVLAYRRQTTKKRVWQAIVNGIGGRERRRRRLSNNALKNSFPALMFLSKDFSPIQRGIASIISPSIHSFASERGESVSHRIDNCKWEYTDAMYVKCLLSQTDFT